MPMIVQPSGNIPLRVPTDYQRTTTTIPSSNVGSFYTQARNILAQWQELQEKKVQYQKQQQQQEEHSIRVGFWGEKHQNYDDFDRIMEEDLEYQLKELERQEVEQYQRMEQTLEEQLQQQQHQKNSTEQMAEFEHYCMELLKQSEHCCMELLKQSEHYCMELLKQSEQLQQRIESQINVLQQQKYSSTSSNTKRQMHKVYKRLLTPYSLNI